MAWRLAQHQVEGGPMDDRWPVQPSTHIHTHTCSYARAIPTHCYRAWWCLLGCALSGSSCCSCCGCGCSDPDPGLQPFTGDTTAGLGAKLLSPSLCGRGAATPRPAACSLVCSSREAFSSAGRNRLPHAVNPQCSRAGQSWAFWFQPPCSIWPGVSGPASCRRTPDQQHPAMHGLPAWLPRPA